MKGDYFKISPTALICANFRGKYTEIPYSKEIFAEIDGENASKLSVNTNSFVYDMLNRVPKIFPKSLIMVSIFEGRYCAINNAIKECGDCSVIEAASGLSPRGLEFVDKGYAYIETDLPGMIGLKKLIVEEVKKKQDSNVPENHLFTELNPVNSEEMERVGKLYKSMETGKPIVFVNEGLFMYLNKDEQKMLRDNVRSFLDKYSPDGAWVTTDFVIEDYENRNMNLPMRTVKNFVKKGITMITGRDFTRFKSEAEIQQFLKEGGFDHKKLPVDSVVDELTCIDKANLDMDRVKEMTETYHPYMITPDNQSLT